MSFEDLRDLYTAAIEERLNSLDDEIHSIAAEPTGGRAGLATVGRLLKPYVEWFRTDLWRRLRVAGDDADEVDILRKRLELLILKASAIDSWFMRGGSHRIPLSLFEAVNQYCKLLGVAPADAVFVVGSPDNFELLPTELLNYFYGTKPPPQVVACRAILIQVPSIEGATSMWRPIILGHELAHWALQTNPKAKAVLQRFREISGSGWLKYPGITRIGDRETFNTRRWEWRQELLCDALTVNKFGPAGAAALAEFLEADAPREIVDRRVISDHPPEGLRIELALYWARKHLPKGEHLTTRIERLLGSWEGAEAVPDSPSMLQSLISDARTGRDEIWESTIEWAGKPYSCSERELALAACIKSLSAGLPPERFLSSEPVNWNQRRQLGKVVADTDIINAGWIERSRLSPWPVGRLVGKAIDSLWFLHSWKSSVVAEELPPAASSQPAGVLSKGGISHFLNRIEDRLTITPLLSRDIKTASVDLRLGTQFIVFRRTGTAAFSSVDWESDARSLQRLVEVGWKQFFVLHPHELALATSLEYIELPCDLSAQVITRSSYGRLGLITATAVQVHPYFRGCLTLELLNLGQVPIQLRPGERIAQLVFMTVDPKAPIEPETYACPTGPEFSRYRSDVDEARALGLAPRSSLTPI